MAEKVDWADPGYFSGNSRIGNSVRVLVQLIRPPKGHRTLPTKTGLFLILITIGVGTAGFNTGQNILYLATMLSLPGSNSSVMDPFPRGCNIPPVTCRAWDGRARRSEASEILITAQDTAGRRP